MRAEESRLAVRMVVQYIQVYRHRNQRPENLDLWLRDPTKFGMTAQAIYPTAAGQEEYRYPGNRHSKYAALPTR